MNYLSELRANIRLLVACSLGVGAGLSLFGYASSIMAPHLLKEFGWSKALFALVGLSMFTTILVVPIVGRWTDRIGARRMAALGAVLTPAAFFCFSLMQGPFYQYLIVGVLVLGVGSMTTPVVYSRLIAANFQRARGLALTIVTSAPALIGAIGAPLFSDFVDAQGWRPGYRALALFVLAMGLIAVLLIRKDDAGATPAEVARVKADGKKPGSYRELARQPLLWIILVGMFLCVLPTPLHSSQMNMMLLDNQITTATAARMVSIYAVGTVLGRLACGLALDRFSTPIVAALSMGLPAIGYAFLASDYNSANVIAFSMFLIGLSMGAEGDLLSFLVARYFPLEIFSTVAGLVYASVYFGSAVGAVTLSFTLKQTDHFTFFMWLTAATVLAGGLLLLALARYRPVEDPHHAH